MKLIVVVILKKNISSVYLIENDSVEIDINHIKDKRCAEEKTQNKYYAY